MSLPGESAMIEQLLKMSWTFINDRLAYPLLFVLHALTLLL